MISVELLGYLSSGMLWFTAFCRLVRTSKHTVPANVRFALFLIGVAGAGSIIYQSYQGFNPWVFGLTTLGTYINATFASHWVQVQFNEYRRKETIK